jgi:hypothetical protein
MATQVSGFLLNEAKRATTSMKLIILFMWVIYTKNIYLSPAYLKGCMRLENGAAL